MQNEHFNIEDIMALVISSGCLGNSLRQQQLLKYLLIKNKEGRAEKIKTQNIAMHVLGRAEDFDNNTDSIVRVEMHRLRKHLSLFNSTSNTLKISIPKASYCVELVINSTSPTPAFSPRMIKVLLTGLVSAIAIVASGYFIIPQTIESINATNSPHACSNTKPNLLLQKSITIDTNETLDKDTSLLVDNFLQRGLNQFAMMNIVNENVDCSKSGTPFFNLHTEIFPNGHSPFISLMVKNYKTQKVVYSQKIDMLKSSDGLDKTTSLEIYKFTSTMASLNGIIPQKALTADWSQSTLKQWYSCPIMIASHFSGHYITAPYKEAIHCMERSLKSGNQDANLIGMLAILYIDQYQAQVPHITKNPKAAAEKLLSMESVQLSSNPWILGAKLRLEADKRPIDEAEIRRIIEALTNQQPYHAQGFVLMSQIVGYAIGDWQFAKELSDKAAQLDSQPNKSIYFTEIGYALLYGTTEEAHDLCHKLYNPGRRFRIIMCLATANKTGNTAEAQRYRDELAQLKIVTTEDVKKVFQHLNASPQITAEVLKWAKLEDENNEK